MLDLIGCLIKLSTTEVTYCKVSNHFLMFGLLLVFFWFLSSQVSEEEWMYKDS